MSQTTAAPAERYDASSITILAGLEAVRQRPAMYIGSTGPAGLHHLIFEVVENAIDESLAGHCSRIEIALHADGSCAVTDDGRGIPVDPHPSDGRPAAEVVLTTLHAGGKFGSASYAVSGGLHGVGVSCVNALSESLDLDIWRGGRHYTQRYLRGAPGPLGDVGPAERRGTQIRFLPDRTIFTDAGDFSFDLLTRRFEELAFLNPGVRLELSEESTGRRSVFQYDSGIIGFVEHLNQSRTPIHPAPILVRGERGGLEVEAALQWTVSYSEDLRSFVNSIRTPQGGAHVEGLKAALTQTINRYAAEAGLLNADNGEHITGADIREGVTCVLSVRMSDPEFEGQTKSVLSSPEATGAVEAVVTESLATFLRADPDAAAPIVGKALEASRARLAARRASERARYQVVDPTVSVEVYQKQFGIRSKNWHDSAAWLANDGLLGAHAAMCQAPEDALVLDTCCGSGVVGNSFRDKVPKGRIIGLDITPEMIAMAKTRLDEVIQGNVYDIPFPDETFDMVVNREVLHLLPQPERPVREMFRVLKPGGQFVVGMIIPFAEEDAAWMYRIFKKKQPLLFSMFQEQDFRELLEGAGFVDLTMDEYMLWEDIDRWIDTHETTSLHRHEIRDLFYNAPAAVRDVHPFEIRPDGRIMDCWRWCIFSAFKPA